MAHFALAVAFVAAPVAVQPAQAPPAPSAIRAAPAVDQAHLALARATADSLFPSGSSARLISEMMGGADGSMFDGILDMTPGDFGMKGPAGQKIGGPSLRQDLRKSDPHFEERMRIIQKVLAEEVGRIGLAVEPAMRGGLALALVRRFTAAQLTDANRFLATDSGRAFGRDLMLLWTGKEMIKAMISTAPMMIKEMPAVMKKIDAATAHLPKPKKSEPAAAKPKPK